MTLYEKIRFEISECIKRHNAFERIPVVDISTVEGFDFYSNAPKILGSELTFDEDIPFVSEYSIDNGFLNFRLKDAVFIEFLSEFQIIQSETDDEFEKEISAYIQLAEDEKNLSGEPVLNLELTSEVKRIICLLMKFQYAVLNDSKKAVVIMAEIRRLLNKLEVHCENLKSFVIIYEPLLIAVRGSLAKYSK